MKISRQSGRNNYCGEKIRKIRCERGLSQENLAVKMQLAGYNITQKAISRIELGERIIPDYELRYFAEALNVSVCLLLDLTKDGFL